MAESKLEDILQKEKPSGGKPTTSLTDLRTTLEQELEGEDSQLAKELQRTRAEEIIARRRITIDRMRAGQVGQDTVGVKTQQRGREWLVDVAQGLLERGLDPSIVGRTIDYLLGNAQAPLVGLPGAPAPAQGMTFADMMAFYKMVQESNKSDPAITTILDRLTTKIEQLESRAVSQQPPAKTNYVLVKADGSIQEIESGKPIILEPKPTTGQPLEVVKEQNRHAEKMKEIEIEGDFKQKLGDLAEEIPVNIGRGWAAESASRRSGHSSTSFSEKESVDSFPCEKCGTAIFYSLSNPLPQIKCAKCDMVYEQKPSPEPVTPAPSPTAPHPEE